MSLTGNISDISRASLHDGPGVRTVVYFKGCSLSCKWCHNPETISVKKHISLNSVKCICCGECIKSFPECHAIENGKMKILHNNCTACGKCIAVCPANALSVIGDHKSVNEIMETVLKDKHYYTESGGGVTLSGGECLLQADFCAELLKSCQAEGINTCIETALFVPFENLEKVLPYCDGFFADFKIAENKKHKKYTGQENFFILDNLKKLTEKAPKRVTVRIPLIPTVNDSDADITAFAEKLMPFVEKLNAVEILRYNNLAKSKYEQIEKEFTDFGEPQTDEFIKSFTQKLQIELGNKVTVFTK